MRSRFFRFFSSQGAILQAAFWIVLFAFVVYLSRISFGWPAGFFRAVLIVGCHLANFYVCYSLIVPRYFEKKKYAKAAGILLLLILVLTPLRYFIENHFLALPHARPVRFLTFRGLLGFIVFSELSIAGFASLLRLAVNNERHQRRMHELENLHLETELRFLKAQMHPHFLFNIINNIYTLTVLKSDKAPEALLKLSGLLRYLLYESHGKVPLVKETEALQTYCDLVQLRYETLLDVHISDQTDGRPIFIEPLLLIPLMENAVKHSGLGIISGAYARLRIEAAGEALSIRLENHKMKTDASEKVGGIGLANIRKRLQLLYPGKHILQLEETADRFIVHLKIPLA